MTLKAAAIKVQLDLENTPSLLPMPPDSVALAHWIGVKHRVLWWLILNRQKLYKEFRIPKSNGKFRVLHEPQEHLKYAQRMVLERILIQYPVPQHIGAYEEERGVKYTTERHAGHKVVLELDIRDFFGSTTRLYVRQFFYSLGWPQETSKLMADLLTYPVKTDFSVVPQGAPSSPTLCNLIGDRRFDQEILSFLNMVNSGWVYTRYSDNLIISHPDERTREEVNLILREIKDIVRAGGYRINPAKIKIMRSNHPKRPQHLLGLTVNQKPNINIQQYKRLRAQVDRAYKQGFHAVHGLPGNVMTVPQTISHLTGVINYFIYIHPSPKLLKLKSKFQEAVKKEKAKTTALMVV